MIRRLCQEKEMETIEEDLLERVDRVIEPLGVPRSAFIRQMLCFRNGLPKPFSLWLDALTGMALSMQALHYLFVERPIATTPDISIRDRSWRNLQDKVNSAS